MSLPASKCSRCASAVESGDLRCPVCYLLVPEDPAAGERAGSARVELLRCRSCGAAMEYRASVQAPQCAFCGGVLKLEEAMDPPEQTESYLPFTVDRAQAVEVYRGWLSKQGFFQPSDLASASRLESLRALWWVGWVVDAEAFVTWTLDSDAGAERADWAPQAGEFTSHFDNLVIPATRGLSAAESARLAPTYGLQSGVSEPGAAGQDVVQERFEVPRSFARTWIIGAIQQITEARIRGGQAAGSRFRNIHAAVHLRGLATRRVAFPAYVLAYRYRGRLHRTVISGQDPACVFGEVPRSWLKVGLVVALALAGLGGILAFLLGVLR